MLCCVPAAAEGGADWPRERLGDHPPRVSRTLMPASIRRGPLRVSYRATPADARVLFAVPKSVGTAVVRNRARRRVRAALRELAGDGTIVLAGGEYRLGISSSLEGLSAAELRTALGEMLGDIR